MSTILALILSTAPVQIKTTASASASTVKGVKTYETVSVGYQFLRYPGNDPDDSVIETRVIGREAGGVEMVRGTVEVARKRMPAKGRPSTVWKVSTPAEHVEVHRDYDVFVTEADGCCGKSQTKRLYSLRDGAFLFPYSSPQGLPLVIAAPQLNQARWIGYMDAYWPALDRPEYKEGDGKAWQTFGVLTYGSDDKALQRLVVLRKPWSDPSQDPVTFTVTDDLQPNSIPRQRSEPCGTPKRRCTTPEATFDGLVIHLRFAENEPEIAIAVKKDRLVVDMAGIPPEYKLVELPP